MTMKTSTPSVNQSTGRQRTTSSTSHTCSWMKGGTLGPGDSANQGRTQPSTCRGRGTLTWRQLCPHVVQGGQGVRTRRKRSSVQLESGLWAGGRGGTPPLSTRTHGAQHLVSMTSQEQDGGVLCVSVVWFPLNSPSLTSVVLCCVVWTLLLILK